MDPKKLGNALTYVGGTGCILFTISLFVNGGKNPPSQAVIIGMGGLAIYVIGEVIKYSAKD